MSDPYELELGDDFEKLLRSRLQGHQEQLDKHRTNVHHKIDWLSPEEDTLATQQTAQPCEPRQVPKPRHNFPKNQAHADLTANPTISSISKQLAMKRRIADGVANMPIEDSLAIRADKSRAEAWLRAQSEAELGCPGHPCISQFAAALPSSTVAETTNRLYQTGVSNERVLQALKVQLELLVNENMELSFKPRITAKAQNLTRRPNHSAHNDLYEQATETHNARAASRLQRERDRESELRSRTPTLNRLSSAIAERLPHTTEDRLLRPQPRPQETTPRRAHSQATGRTAALYQDHQLRQARQLQRMHENDQLPLDCTFTPSIKTKQRHARPLTERTANWDNQRRQKLDQQRSAQAADEIAMCTFQPAINDGKKYAEATLAHAGVAEFVARQRQARNPDPHSTHMDGDAGLRKALEALERARATGRQQL